MKFNTANRNNIILAILSLVLVGVVVYYFFNRDTTPEALLASVSSTQSPKIEGNLLQTLQQLKAIKLNDSIFINSVFTRLTDFSQPLVSQGTPGRSNPFAPIGNDVFSLQNNSSTVTTPPAKTTP